jgi:hypothetical protein
MRQLLLWLARLFGAFLVLYGVLIAYQTWYWTHLGLHQRIYDGETQVEIQFNIVSYAVFHAPSMRYAFLFVASGIVIVLQTFVKMRHNE